MLINMLFYCYLKLSCFQVMFLTLVDFFDYMGKSAGDACHYVRFARPAITFQTSKHLLCFASASIAL